RSGPPPGRRLRGTTARWMSGRGRRCRRRFPEQRRSLRSRSARVAKRGRREGLKIPWPQGRAGSIPAPGTWSAESAPTRNARPEEPQQHGCVADLTITGGIHERHAPALAPLCQRIERLLRGRIRELTLVALLELDPFCGIMLVPLAQRVRRRDALLPGIQPGILLFHSPRPESLDQNAISI